MITLGIETSCDETGIALLDGEHIVADRVYSQLEHSAFGGVIPEIASRAHLEKIDRLFALVMSDASLAAHDIDGIAVTDSPGLAGALLIGISFALGLHVRHAIPLTGINHLEGHICAILLSHPAIELPFIALVVSGGHTALYRVDGIGTYTCLGQTVDDAAGEAFDKVGKMIGFSYPAGRSIENEARKATGAVSPAFPIASLGGRSLSFSFSGLKTAVKYFVREKGAAFISEYRPDICRAFQEAVVASLAGNCEAASRSTGISRIAIVGGVACNTRLREEMKNRFGDGVFFPPPELCVDNGAMIACAGARRFAQNQTHFPRMHPDAPLS
jgi:N6-L-threonylcarbamoyladenine synthase